MAKWLECRSYTNPGATVWVNLDLVAKISGGKEGSTLDMANGEQTVVANLAQDILADEKVRLVA